MTTFAKKQSMFDFVHKNFNSFFLEFKTFSCTHFFFSDFFYYYLVEKKVLEKKNIQSFFMRHCREWGYC